MPLQSNIIHTIGVVAFEPDGTTPRPFDIRKHTMFNWVFEATADIATDAVYNVEAAPASATDPCVPGAFVPVEEVSICDSPMVAGPQATLTIPAGTLAGTICAGTIPCRPDVFVQLVPVSGDTANLSVVSQRHGPKI